MPSIFSPGAICVSPPKSQLQADKSPGGTIFSMLTVLVESFVIVIFVLKTSPASFIVTSLMLVIF